MPPAYARGPGRHTPRCGRTTHGARTIGEDGAMGTNGQGGRFAARAAAVVGIALACVAAGEPAGAGGAYDASDPVQRAAHDSALAIGTAAYQYGIPLLDTDRTFRTVTSVN